MGDVVFAYTRHVYESYADFKRLVELAGFATCYVDEIDAHDASKTYVITPLNGEWGAGWKAPKARLIHWDLEWRLDGDYPVIPGIVETWTSDAWYAKRTGTRYVVMGSDARLAQGDAPEGEGYDVAYLGYMIPRRTQIAHDLTERGLKLSPSSAWNGKRHRVLSTSRAYLHVHQHAHAPTVAPLRMVVAAAYRLPVISERVEDRGAFGYGCMMTADYRYLADFVRMWICGRGNAAQLADYGYALHSFLCEERTFRKSIEAAI